MRLFVAADVPDAPRAALAEHGRALAQAGGWRAVPEASLHLTLAFLGERPDGDAAPIAAALDAVVAAGASAPPTALGAPVLLPPRAPRVAAVRLEDPGGAVAALQGAVSRALVELGVHTPERRAFLPHVTVARRVRGPAGGPVAGSAGDSVAGPAASARFVLPSVTLYRSRLSRAGARYEAVHRAPLP